MRYNMPEANSKLEVELLSATPDLTYLIYDTDGTVYKLVLSANKDKAEHYTITLHQEDEGITYQLDFYSTIPQVLYHNILLNLRHQVIYLDDPRSLIVRYGGVMPNLDVPFIPPTPPMQLLH